MIKAVFVEERPFFMVLALIAEVHIKNLYIDAEYKSIKNSNLS